MAWLWWLLAPVVVTVAGALVLAGRARYEGRFDTDRIDPMAQHRHMLQTLAESARTSEPPSTMIVLEPEPLTGSSATAAPVPRPPAA